MVQYATNLSQTSNWQTLTNLTLPGSPYLWVDTSTPATVQRFYRVETPTNCNQSNVPGMALVPAGLFLMGDCVDGESDAPTSTVYVSAFYMDTNLVSYALWQQIYQWGATNGYSFDAAGSGLGSNYPVQTIDWYDAVKWCNARSQMAGLTPVYYTDTNLTQIYKTGDVAACANWTVSGYRLPTEAEWEKAARGGLPQLRFPWGNTISESLANYDGDPYNGNFGYPYDLGPPATMRHATPGIILPVTRVRWDILDPTALAFTTWLGMCLSGAGIGMGRMRSARRPILTARPPARTAYCAAAVGSSSRTNAGRRSAMTTPRTLITMRLASGLSCPRASRDEPNPDRGGWRSPAPAPPPAYKKNLP